MPFVVSLYLLNIFSFFRPEKRHVRDCCFKCGFPFSCNPFCITLQCDLSGRRYSTCRCTSRTPTPHPHTTANIYFTHVLFVYETVQCVCGQSYRMPVRLISVPLNVTVGTRRGINFLSYTYNNNNIYYFIILLF